MHMFSWIIGSHLSLVSNNFYTNEQLSRLPGGSTLEEEKYVEIYIPSDPLQHVEGNSMMREILVDKI